MGLVNGLPAHILLVHVVVVLVPLTAIVLVAGVIWPTWIRRLGIVLPVLALVTLVSVPLATSSGEWLAEHSDSNPLVVRHTDLGEGLLPWVVGLFVFAAAVWWFDRKSSATSGADQDATVTAKVPVRIAAVVLSVVVAAGSVVQVYRIGDSGAQAAWSDGYSATPVSDHVK
jgi:hypothetical protein